jgi:Glycosyl transferases group 1
LRALWDLARECGVATRVHFVGPASDTHKWALYAEAEMFLLASHSENFGIAAAEALAMGCPVIVTRQVGIASWVMEADAGIVVDPEDPAISRAVNSLRSDTARRRGYGTQGTALVREHLGWDRIASQMEEAYEESGRAARRFNAGCRPSTLSRVGLPPHYAPSASGRAADVAGRPLPAGAGSQPSVRERSDVQTGGDSCNSSGS